MTTQDPFEQSQTGFQPQLRLAFDLALWRQQEQVERARALDGKLGQTIGLSAAMIAVFGSAVLLVGADDLSRIGDIVRIAAGLFIANVVVSAAAAVVGRWTLAPNLRGLLALAESADEAKMLTWVTAALVEAIARNERWLWGKGILVSVAIGLTAATAVTIAVGAILAAPPG